MTQHDAVGTDAGKGRGPIVRLLFALPLAALLIFLCLLALSLTGWGFETDPAAQLLRDAPWVVLAGLAGASAGAVLAWSVLGRLGWTVALGAGLGAIPMTVMVTAYFTDTY